MIDDFRLYCRESKVPVVTVFILLFVSSVVFAQGEDAHAQHKQMMQQEKAGANLADITLPEAILINQDGEEVRLADDVVGDRIVVVDFVYTTCTTVCPVLSAIFSQVQNKLGDRVGDDVVMVSISVDPARDTPARMKSYADKIGAGDGWLWLTGQKQTVTQVLEDFGAYTPNFEDHPSMILVGDGTSGQWSRFLGFPGADQIVGKVNEFSASRMAHQAHAAMQEKE
jgi:protein SCO1/2